MIYGRYSVRMMERTLTERQLYHNCRVKIYPDGSRDILVASAPIFRVSGYEERGADATSFEALKDRLRSEKLLAEAMEIFGDTEDFHEPKVCKTSANIARSKRRARAAVSDLAMCNDFKYFVTLTLDEKAIDRYDMKAITKRLNTWLDNRVRRDGLKYVLVAEHHKDKAVHFHGFFNDALAVEDSGTMVPPSGGKPKRPKSKAQKADWLANGGHIVFNLPAWDFGYTTAIELYGTRRAAIGYVCKYITKAQEKIGGRWYYSGGNLKRPEIQICVADYRAFSQLEDVASFVIDELGVSMIKCTVEGGESLEAWGIC